MPVTSIRRLLTTALRTSKTISTTRRLSTSSPPPLPPETWSRSRTRTLPEIQFEKWIDLLKPGFTTDHVETALRNQWDADLALDIFRWTSQQRDYKHDHRTYETMLKILLYYRRFPAAEFLLDEILAGACDMNLSLYNTAIRICCSRWGLFIRAFDCYNAMIRSQDCKPDLNSYTMLFSVLLKKFRSFSACLAHIESVASLNRQMLSQGIIPDTYVLNLIIKAYSRCKWMEDAARVFRQMGLYNCQPNEYSYGYLVQGYCEAERVDYGKRFFMEMRRKELVPSGRTFMVLICSLAIVGRHKESAEIVFDMIGCEMSPDLLTYRTVVDEMCRAGRFDAASKLVKEFRRRDVSMSQQTYRRLLSELYGGDHN